NSILFEFENIYMYMIMLTKKRYTCIKIDPEEAINIKNNSEIEIYGKTQNKGISIVRRDYTQLHKELLYKCIMFIKDNIKNKNTNIDEPLKKLVLDLINNV